MSFTLLLGSFLGTQDVAGQNSSVTYNIDWHNVSKGYEGEYDVTFSFTTSGILTSTSTVLVPVLEWGAVPDAFEPTNIITTSTGAKQSFALGFVKPLGLGGNTVGYFQTDVNQNPPVRISGKPTQNQFRIKTLNAFGGGVFGLGVVSYVMNIRFKAVDSP